MFTVIGAFYKHSFGNLTPFAFLVNLNSSLCLWVYKIILFGISLFWHFLNINFNFLNYSVWLKFTDEGNFYGSMVDFGQFVAF